MSRSHLLPFRMTLLSFGSLVLFGLLESAVVRAQQTDATNATEHSDAADPIVVNYPENEEPKEVPGDNTIEPRPISPAQKESLRRRAGEQVGNVPQGRAVVLGMHIQEADKERARVVEVAPASPAFDAGIRKGDEIVSFDGYKATKYREWIDGIRKLATDAPDGDTLPIVLMRDNKRLNLRLRIPVAKAGAVPPADDITLNQTIVPDQVGPVVPGQQQPYIIPYGGGVGGGGDVLVADAFGDDFNSPDGDNAGRAIAHLFRLNTPQPNEPVNGAQNPAGAAQPNSRIRDRASASGAAAGPARVGIAGLRNDANGMLVMLDVGGLEPGNYLVGIDDPSLLTSGANQGGTLPNENPNNPRARTNSARRNRTPTQNPSPPSPVPLNGTAPSGQQPAPGTQQSNPNPVGSENAPQSGLQTPAVRNAAIPRTVLAQVADSTQAGAAPANNSAPGATPSDVPATGQAQPLTNPATGTVQPPDTPATGQVEPLDATATGLPRVDDTLQDPNLANSSGDQSVVPNGGAGPALQVGTLTIDQSGTGRLQQVVESVRVQDVVGQAIVIYSQNGNPQTILPPNLNAGADPLAGPGAGAAQARGTGVGTAQPADARSNVAGAGQQGAPNAAVGSLNATTNGANGIGRNVPVAGGVIQMMSERVPNATGDDAASQGVPSPQSPENQQPVPQNSAVPSGAGQPNIR